MSKKEAPSFEKVWAMFQETSLQMKETDKRMEKTLQRLSERIELTNKQIGYLGGSLGEVVELIKMIKGKNRLEVAAPAKGNLGRW